MKDITTIISQFVTSSVGRKIIVALTGACLLLFLVGHLVGNLTIYGGMQGGDETSWINYYAQGLHAMPAWLLWSIRLGLLAIFVIHIALTLVLKWENVNARTKYQVEGTLKATISSRYMVLTGVTILLFALFHLWQFTYNGDPAHCYAIITTAFKNPWCSIFYIAAISCLFLHMRHGFQSVFQTLGLSTKKVRPLLDMGSIGFALFVCGAYISIPLSVLFGILK